MITPFDLSMTETSVIQIKDQAWAGVTVAPLVYEWVGGQRPTKPTAEQAVCAEMRDWKREL